MTSNSLKGTGVALITPFNTDLTVDHQALANIVNFNIENGINYLVVLGTTSESATLNHIEKKAIITTIVKANNNRVPLVLGVGGNNTQAVVEELKTTDFSAFSAILSVSPYYNKPTQEGIYQHFKTIALAAPKPVILYNVPGRTASNILPDTVVRLANSCPNIIGIKEAAGNMLQAMQLIKQLPKTFLVISGDDMMTLPMILAGGAGVISVIGQGFPKQFSEMVALGIDGKTSQAYKIHYQLMDIIDLIFEEGNPAGIKAVFEYLEFCDSNVRLPLVKASDTLKDKIEIAVNAINKTV